MVFFALICSQIYLAGKNSLQKMSTANLSVGNILFMRLVFFKKALIHGIIYTEAFAISLIGYPYAVSSLGLPHKFIFSLFLQILFHADEMNY